MPAEALLLAGHERLCVVAVRSLEWTGGLDGEVWLQISTSTLTEYRLKNHTPADKCKQVIVCQWLRDKIDVTPDFLDSAWFLDGKHFYILAFWIIRINSSRAGYPQNWAIILYEVNCFDRPLPPWYHWTILGQGRQRAICENQHRTTCFKCL